MHGGSGPLAQAEIQTDGTYSLRTDGFPGAVHGWHRVTVAAVEPSDMAERTAGYVTPRSLLPLKYRDPELSGLTCEVKPSVANTVDFHLE